MEENSLISNNKGISADHKPNYEKVLVLIAQEVQGLRRELANSR